MGQACKIIFDEYSDRNKFLNAEVVKQLCEFLLIGERDKRFLVVLADIIYEYNCYNDLFDDDYIDNYYEEVGTDTESILFLNLILNLYKFGDSGKPNSNMGCLRGAVLERISASLIADGYLYPPVDIHFPLDNFFKEGCELRVNCKVKLPQISWETINPIDIGAWNTGLQKGQCYECKVNLLSMEDSDDLILSELQSKSEMLFRDEANLEVGVITFFRTEPYKGYKNYNNIKLYGRNNLHEIRITK